MYLKNFKTIVIKIGSSLLINDKKTIRKKWLSEFAKDVKDLLNDKKNVIIVSSGAIALGCKKLNLNKKNFKIINKAVGDNSKETIFYQLDESSSSTLNEINQDSNYYKKKNLLINFFSFNKPKTIEFKLKPILLSDFIDSNNIKKIDILKIDTEGYEFRVVKGLNEKIKFVDYIYFEHHYDDMIKKGYTFSMIHNYLKQNGFKKVFKLKMPFRKSFEYVYQNINMG